MKPLYLEKKIVSDRGVFRGMVGGAGLWAMGVGTWDMDAFRGIGRCSWDMGRGCNNG